MEEALLGRREEWDAGPAEGLVFVRTRDAGKSGGGEVGQEVCGGVLLYYSFCFFCNELVTEGLGGDGLEERSQGLIQPARWGMGKAGSREGLLRSLGAQRMCSLNLWWCQLAQL